MNETPVIRALRATDLAEWRRLWTGYLDFYGASVGEEVYATTFARLIDPGHTRQHALVAEHEGRLRGLVHYIFHAHNWRIEEVCYLQDLYVDADMRGLGLGRLLIEAVYGATAAHGANHVYWLTQDSNAQARRLYDHVAELTPFIRYQHTL